jgi:hypothetical protein
LCICREGFGKANTHHRVVLLCSRPGVGPCSQAETLTGGAKSCFVNLPAVLDDVDGVTIPVGEGGDVLVCGVPSHFSAMALKSLDERDGLIGCHV